MNRIEAIKGQTICSGEHLVIAVDGVPLDQLLHTAFPSDYFENLIPTLLPWMRAEWERALTWKRILPRVGSSAIAPVLICPDDRMFGCNDVVAEVIAEAEVICWNRLGRDRSVGIGTSSYDLGTTVKWLPGVGPYNFERPDYETFIQVFKQEFETCRSLHSLAEPWWPTVYKSKDHLDFDPDEVGAVHDPEMGLYDFPEDYDSALERRFPYCTRIASRKVFDVDALFALRTTVVELVSADSITAKFLKGDHPVIQLALIPQLCQELQALRRHAEERARQALLTFVGDMEELAEAALREGNPISVLSQRLDIP